MNPTPPPTPPPPSPPPPRNGPTQEDNESRRESSSYIQDVEPTSSPTELAIKDQKETRVSEGHVNTRFFIISDIHTDVFKPEQVPEAPAASADVLICCGDLTVNSELREYLKVIDALSKVAAPLKLVVAGNHDGTLDSKGFWDAGNWRYKGWPREKEGNKTKLFGVPGEARRVLKHNGFIVLDEGHHRFGLGNGAELYLYASPATPKRSSRYRAFQYKKGAPGGHSFSINKDVDVVITHGPPKGIRDPSPEGSKYEGCEDLFDAIATARPRLHCFGHNHGGWGSTFVEWQHVTDGGQLKNKESTISLEKDLMSLEDIDPAAYESASCSRTDTCRETKRQLAITRCVPTSHCAADTSFVKKGEQTLFVNASWSKISKHDTGTYTQWPWLVDIELPRRQDSKDPTNACDAVQLQTSNSSHDGAEVSTTEKPSAKGCPLIFEQASPFQKIAGEYFGQRKPLQVNPWDGARCSPEEKTKRGINGWVHMVHRPAQNTEVKSWRKPTAEAEQQAGDKDGLEGPSRPQGDGTQPRPREKPVNKKYGFSNRHDRNTSGPWRRDSGDNRSSDGNGGSVGSSANGSNHQDVNTWGWGQK